VIDAMKNIGLFEAKQKLSELVERAAASALELHGVENWLPC